jgi:hypothetical protein
MQYAENGKMVWGTKYDEEFPEYLDGNQIPPYVFDVMVTCAKGAYQMDLIINARRWSGADLAGKAAEYAGSYRTSREALFSRLKTALSAFPGEWYPAIEACGRHRKNMLIIHDGLNNYAFIAGRPWPKAYEGQHPNAPII